MNEFDLLMFGWMAPGDHPGAWAVSTMRVLAMSGAWISAALVMWAALRHRGELGFIAATIAACGGAQLVSHFIASLLNFPRPFVLGLSPEYINHGASGSMPSTHASVMFILAFLWMARPRLRRFGWAALTLAAATGWARVYVGVHFPSDIVGGAILAAVFALLFNAVSKFLHPRRTAPDSAGNMQTPAQPASPPAIGAEHG